MSIVNTSLSTKYQTLTQPYTFQKRIHSTQPCHIEVENRLHLLHGCWEFISDLYDPNTSRRQMGVEVARISKIGGYLKDHVQYQLWHSFCFPQYNTKATKKQSIVTALQEVGNAH